MHSRALGCLLLACLFTACREPASVEQFLPGEGPFTFPVSMADTAAFYDFDFYTRIDDRPDRLRSLRETPLSVVWSSPSGKLMRETVYLPLEGKMSFFSRQVRVPYRAGVQPSETGDWKLIITLPSPPEGLRGLGLVVTRK